jgi:hypothetical protein
MLAAIIAAAALAAAPDAGAAPPVSLVAPPAQPLKFVGRPTAAEFISAYPHGPASVGMGGRALLHCDVGKGGRLGKCTVAAEAPSGAGFGGAALSLSGLYHLDPASDAAKSGAVEFAIGFATATDENELEVTGPWLAAPGFADVGAVYPDIGGGVTGEAVLHCRLDRQGAPTQCKSLYERPVDRGFNDSALKLAHLFRARIDPLLLGTHQPLGVNVMLRIASPNGAEARDRRISDPAWLTRLDPADLARLYPAQAAAKGVKEGVGYADCTVAADGALTACQPFGGDPPDLGFSEAAVQAVSPLRMSPWTDAGGPVDGARVRIPVSFAQAAGK